MRFRFLAETVFGVPHIFVIVDRGNDEFTSFPAAVGNPNYDAFLESQGLTDAEVQAMEPDIWHDMT